VGSDRLFDGGSVSVEAAKRLGDRVIGVVGIDTFYTGFEVPNDQKKAAQMVDGFLKPFEENYPEASANFMRGFFAPGADPALVERITKATGSADKNMALSAMRNMFGWYSRNVPARSTRSAPSCATSTPTRGRPQALAPKRDTGRRLRAFHPAGETGGVQPGVGNDGRGVHVGRRKEVT